MVGIWTSPATRKISIVPQKIKNRRTIWSRHLTPGKMESVCLGTSALQAAPSRQPRDRSSPSVPEQTNGYFCAFKCKFTSVGEQDGLKILAPRFEWLAFWKSRDLQRNRLLAGVYTMRSELFIIELEYCTVTNIVEGGKQQGMITTTIHTDDTHPLPSRTACSMLWPMKCQHSRAHHFLWGRMAGHGGVSAL